MIDNARIHEAWLRVYGTAFMDETALQFAREVEKEMTRAAPRDVTPEVLAHLSRLTVDLTRLRQEECRHLCVENFAPKLLGDLIGAWAKAN